MRAEYDTLEVKRSEISDRLRIVRASDGSRNKAYWDEFNRLRNESIETANKLTNLEKRLRSYEGSKTLSRLIDRERRRQMELFDRQNREEYRNARTKYVVERSSVIHLTHFLNVNYNLLQTSNFGIEQCFAA